MKIISDKIWKIIEECREWPLEFEILWTNKYLVKYSQKKKGATYIYVVSLIEVLFENVKRKSIVLGM